MDRILAGSVPVGREEGAVVFYVCGGLHAVTAQTAVLKKLKEARDAGNCKYLASDPLWAILSSHHGTVYGKMTAEEAQVVSKTTNCRFVLTTNSPYSSDRLGKATTTKSTRETSKCSFS
jgi:hypothetical protein